MSKRLFQQVFLHLLGNVSGENGVTCQSFYNIVDGENSRLVECRELGTGTRRVRFWLYCSRRKKTGLNFKGAVFFIFFVCLYTF